MLIFNSTDETFSKKGKQENAILQFQNLRRKPGNNKRNSFDVTSCFRNTGVVPIPLKLPTTSAVPFPARHPPIPKLNLPPVYRAVILTVAQPMEDLHTMPRRRVPAVKTTSLSQPRTEATLSAIITDKPKVVRTFGFYLHKL
eukprot:GFUD01035300.1.p1 GENE.GFUD01035300.1~~GFUD01035300.1.p1  ORF type:complete len:142 (+),score=22.17 GFUD01035300.1:83-508(+)